MTYLFLFEIFLGAIMIIVIMAFVTKSRCTVSKYFFCFTEAKTVSHDSHQSCHFPTKNFLMISRAFLKVMQGIPCFPQPSNVCFLSSIVYAPHFRSAFPILHLHTPITLHCLRAFHKYYSLPLSIGDMNIPVSPVCA